MGVSPKWFFIKTFPKQQSFCCWSSDADHKKFGGQSPQSFFLVFFFFKQIGKRIAEWFEHCAPNFSIFREWICDNHWELEKVRQRGRVYGHGPYIYIKSWSQQKSTVYNTSLSNDPKSRRRPLPSQLLCAKSKPVGETGFKAVFRTLYTKYVCEAHRRITIWLIKVPAPIWGRRKY